MNCKSIEMFNTKLVLDEESERKEVLYHYVLLESEKIIAGIKMQCFGLKIIKEDICKNVCFYTESDEFEYITTYRYKAVKLLKKLYENCVSPLHLIDVIEPYLEEWINDFDLGLEKTAVQ